MPTTNSLARGKFCRKPSERVAALRSASETSSAARAGRLAGRLAAIKNATMAASLARMTISMLNIAPVFDTPIQCPSV
jgi:hypothetical protein